jgi:hypothetical protein
VGGAGTSANCLDSPRYKVFENRARRAAKRQRLRLRRIRRYDRRAWDYGRYELIGQDGNVVVAGDLRAIYRHLCKNS